MKTFICFNIEPGDGITLVANDKKDCQWILDFFGYCFLFIREVEC